MTESWARGTVIGAFEIDHEIGRGGLGRVLRAHDRRFGRDVAIKVLIDRDSRAAHRFANEAKLTASLQHPSIVPIYEQGTTHDGEQFYVMKLVEGDTLADRIARSASLDDRLALVPHLLDVSRAIAYAHDRGVLHRDIKPANILIGELGEVVIVDWGLGSELGAASGIAGTPGFMAPEQAAGAVADARADVYALGATLRVVLAGTAASPMPPGVPRDLAAIVDRAMQDAAADRYEDARAFAGDLERFLTGRFVSARRYSFGERALRWARRHRAPVTVAAGLLLVLVVSGVIAVLRVTAERDNARTRAAELVLARARAAIDRDPTECVAWLAHYPQDGTRWNDVVALAAEAERRGVARAVYHHPLYAASLAFSPDGRRFATAARDQLARVFEGDSVRFLAGHETWVDRIEFFPDGNRLATGGRDGRLAIWDLAAATGRIAGSRESNVIRTWAFHFLDAGDRIVSAHDHRLRTWTTSTLELNEVRVPGCCLRFVKNAGSTMVGASWSGRITVFQGDTAHRVELGEAGDRADVAITRDGRYVAAVPRGGPVRIYDLAGNDDREISMPDARDGIEFSPDMGTLAIATRSGVRLLDRTTGTLTTIEATAVSLLEFSPDGAFLAIVFSIASTTPAEWKQTLLLHDMRGGPARKLSGHGAIGNIVWSPDSTRLATASYDGQVRVWAVDQVEVTRASLPALTSATVDSLRPLATPVRTLETTTAAPVE